MKTGTNLKNSLTRQDFAESAFLAGNGTDLQPLLRLNHLLKTIPIPGMDGVVASTFVSTTVGDPLNLEALKTAIKGKLRTLATIEPSCLEIVGEPRQLMRHELDVGALKDPDDLFTDSERRAYIEQLVRPNAGNSWAAEVIFERGKGTGRFIRFIHIGGEALATLAALSHEGEFTPKIIVTVQTGPLEEPDGPLARMLSRFTNKPEIWVRGRWAHHDYHARKIELKRLSGGPYSHSVLKFPHWNGSLRHPDAMPASFVRYQAQSIVRAFQLTPEVTLRDKVELKNATCTVRLFRQTLEPKNDGRTMVVTRTVKNRWQKTGHDLTSVVIWNDLIGANHRLDIQPFTLFSALNALEVNPLQKKRYAIIPIGFEDEGFRVLEFLALRKNIEVDIYFEDLLDFADLRAETMSTNSSTSPP
jgi:hypothetical protein